MDFEEFCAAALSVYQLEALDRWDQHARCAYELFEKDGNRPIMIEELASVSYLHFFSFLEVSLFLLFIVVLSICVLPSLSLVCWLYCPLVP